MKSFKRVWISIPVVALILLDMLCALSCVLLGTGENLGDPILATDSGSHLQTSYPKHTKQDFDNRFSVVNLQLAETEDAYLWLPHYTLEQHLQYYDLETGETGILCSRPECMHNDEHCDGYINSPEPSLCIMDGMIYWVAYYHATGSPSFHGIFRCKTDSTGRELVSSIDYPQNFSPQRFYFHRGKLFIYGLTDSVVNGLPNEKLSIMYCNINDGQCSLLVETDFNIAVPTANLKFVGSKLFVFFAGLETEPNTKKIFRVDIETGDVDELMSECALFVMPRGFWVDENERVFASPFGAIDSNRNLLYILRDGVFEEYMDFSDSVDDYVVYPLQDVVIGISADECLKIWVRDYEGNTLYRGIMPADFLESPELPYSVCGDANCVICEFCSKENGLATAKLIMYDISDTNTDPLNYTQLGCSYGD